MSQDKKIIAAEKAIEYVKNGMKLGLGTGSTADEFTKILSKKIIEGLDVICVSTSKRTEKLAIELGIPLSTLSELGSLDLTVDGTDEVDSNLSLIKGGGGALLREKIIAYNSKSLIIIADDTKRVKKLGDFKLPIEISRFEHSAINEKILIKLEEVGYFGKSFIREINNKNFITDGGNFIYDFSIGLIEEPYIVNQLVNSIPGVVENGLFVDMADVVIIGENGKTEIYER